MSDDQIAIFVAAAELSKDHEKWLMTLIATAYTEGRIAEADKNLNKTTKNGVVA